MSIDYIPGKWPEPPRLRACDLSQAKFIKFVAIESKRKNEKLAPYLHVQVQGKDFLLSRRGLKSFCNQKASRQSARDLIAMFNNAPKTPKLPDWSWHSTTTQSPGVRVWYGIGY